MTYIIKNRLHTSTQAEKKKTKVSIYYFNYPIFYKKIESIQT